jgi:Flp pilus assembly protein protease CpaA
MSVFGWVAALCGGLMASGLVRAWSSPSGGGAGRLVLAGSAGVGLCGAGLAFGGPVPVAAALAGVGLAAAVAIDMFELRIPARLALGAAAASAVAFVIEAPSWALVGRAALATAVVVALFGLLWLAGAMGYGDVRLALAVVPTAAAGGSAVGGVAAFLWGACVAAGVTALVARSGRRRSSSGEPVVPAVSVPAVPVSTGGGIPLAGRSPRAGGASPLTIPFAPAIAAGWLLALIVT